MQSCMLGELLHMSSCLVLGEHSSEGLLWPPPSA